MKLYNSLSRQLEEFIPIHEAKVGMYTCGPTVYSFVTIGNWRTYLLGDLLVRSLKYSGYVVDYIMNITDVGHLTGDNIGDADVGEDRLEVAAKKEGRTAWDIAKF
jgi:cysteinyl-tRNA synthetase